jgi:ferrous iron transport protein B
MDCQSCHQKKSIFPFNKTKPPKFPWENTESNVALVGMPNVGKSVLFNALTGRYVTVSNYPGTTVEVSRGKIENNTSPLTLIDTPGLYSLLPITEEEEVTRSLLFNNPLDLIIHVIDGKNLGRMLPLTIQLLEANFPVMVVLNMMDEAKQLGIQIQREKLEEILKIPVFSVIAARNIGIEALKQGINRYVNPQLVGCTLTSHLSSSH